MCEIIDSGAVKYRVIPNSVDVKIFNAGNKLDFRKKLGLPANKFIVLFAANCLTTSRWKDFSLIEKAMSRFSESLGTPDSVLFVGIGQRDITSCVKKGNFWLFPFIKDQSVLADYYRAADVFWHAAKAEVFGKTIIESQACGTPVVATKVGGIPEIIDNGRTGFLVEPGDFVGMAENTKKMLNNNKEYYNRLVTAGIEKIHRNYTLETQVNSYIRWYEEIIEDWHKRKQNG